MTELEPQRFVIRPAIPTDVPFIGAHWVQAQQRLEQGRAHTFSRTLDYVEAFPRVQHRVIDRLLQRETVRALVATSPSNTLTLYGFSLTEGTHLHFVFVRHELRGAGLAVALLGDVLLESCSAWWPAKEGNGVRLAYRPEVSW